MSKRFGKFELSSVSRFWWRVKRRVPWFKHAIDLRFWRDALPDARVVSTLLEQRHSALPPARKALDPTPRRSDDRAFVIKGLSRLHGLLYANSKLPESKPGLSKNIRAQLAREGSR